MPRSAVRAGTLGLLAFAVLSLGLALRAPLTTTAVALMVFGVLHNVLELRYIGGRFSALLGRPLLQLLVALITGIVLVRLVGAAFGLAWTVRAEIVLTYGILGTATWWGLRRYRWAALAGAVVLSGALAASLTWPSYHVVVITHLHNLVPLAFLWEFSRAFTRRARTLFLAVQLSWVVLVPAVMLSGLLDRWMAGTAGTVRTFAAIPQVVAAGTTLPGTWGTTVGIRFLTVFAFLQLMHFVVWVFFLPRYAPATTAAFERRVPWLRGWRTWALGLGAGAALLLLFVVDYGQGRTVYSALASYHAYLELPVLVVMLLSFGVVRVAGTPR
ncbi:hypothetical protein ABIB25_000569 [Nakamurella sp. UYEF19]|uniref:hypothetical protein n=1 Tax=Nakamurella sp. UYEF19 TaxID=1756392 RepID=UPI00339B4847